MALPLTPLEIALRGNLAQAGVLSGPEATEATKAYQTQQLGTANAWNSINPYYNKWTANPNYKAPARGTVGPGGALFGYGLDTGENAYDTSVPGAGLWAYGIDPNDPQAAYSLYTTLAKGGEFGADRPFAAYQNKYDPQGLLSAADAYYAKQSVNMAKDNSFFNSPLGKIIGGGLTALSGGAFGPIGGALFGAAIGGSTGDIGNTLLGAASGFGSGLVTNAGGLSSVVNNPSNLFSSGWYLPGGGGSALGAATGAASSSVPSATGSLVSSAGVPIINGAVAAPAAAGAGTSFLTNVLGGALGVPTGAAGGAGMSFWDSVVSGLGSGLGSAVGQIPGALINYFGQQSASNQISDAAAQAAASAKFNPYNLNTPLGSASFSGNTATGALSPELQSQLAQIIPYRNQAYGALSQFSPQNYANKYYSDMRALRAPGDLWSGNKLMDEVYSSGRWGSTPGANDIFTYDLSKRLEDTALRQTALQAGASEQTRLFDQYMSTVSNENNLLSTPLSLIQAGGNLGGAASNANYAAAQFPWQAATSAADASSAFWGSIAGGVSNTLSNIINKRDQQQTTSNLPAYLLNGGGYQPTAYG